MEWLEPGQPPLVHDYSNVNKLGLLEDFTLPGMQLHELTYTTDFQVDTVTYPSGVELEAGYDQNGYIDNLIVSNPAHGTLASFDYVLNAFGFAESTTGNDGTHAYQYDEAGQLQQATHPPSTGLPALEDFDYDTVGNREQPGDPDFFQYDANNRMTSWNDVQYVYDDDGNLAWNGQGKTLTHDASGNLTSYSAGTVAAEYVYDVFGRRVKKEALGEVVWFAWDGASLLTEYDQWGNRIRRYGHGLGLAPVQYETGGETYAVHADRTGATRMLTDSAGDAVWSASYKAYLRHRRGLRRRHGECRLPVPARGPVRGLGKRAALQLPALLRPHGRPIHRARPAGPIG
jgi:hypothetical protein